MKYCRKSTINHNIALSHNSCLQNINTLIIDEGYLGTDLFFTNEEIILNMDRAETIFAPLENRLQKKSMDMAFGIKSPDSINTKMLMVELRLNYKNPNNLNRAEIEEKVEGTSRILSNIPAIYKLYIFIFKTEQLEEAINRLYRMIPKINTNYVVMDIHQLKEKYF